VAQTEQASEKVVVIVIPSEARNLLFAPNQEKQIPRANPALGMTRWEFYRNKEFRAERILRRVTQHKSGTGFSL
jgi:hypothetical protein